VAGGGPDDQGGDQRVGASQAFTPRTRVLPAPHDEDPRIRLLALTGALVAHDPPTLIGPVGADEAADELVGFLVRHGYLDAAPAVSGGKAGGDR
jgi:electron transfer flavoprotein beta subunit